MTKKAAPSDLRADGRALWKAISSDYDLAVHEYAVLTEAARTVDLLADLEAEILAGGAVVDSPQGRKANPAAVEARQQRLTLARLLAALRIPADDTAGRTQTRPIRGLYRVRGA